MNFATPKKWWKRVENCDVKNNFPPFILQIEFEAREHNCDVEMIITEC